jgi:hypothetical protein
MARRTEKKMKEAGFKFGFGVGKPTSNIMEGIRRRLSKTGLSAADRKKLKELQAKQQKRDAAKTAGEKSAKAKIRAAEKAAKLKKDTKAASAKRAMTAKVTGAEKASEEAKKMMRAKRMDKKPTSKAKSVMSDAQKKGQAGTRQTKKDLGPKGKAPRSVSAAQKAGKLYFMDKNNKPKLAITAEQLKKFMKAKGIKSRKEGLTKFANTYKPGTGMAKFKADMKKMAMGGAMMKKKGMAMGGSMMKKKGMAMGGMKKKGMARGGMKKKGYAMGGLKATNPSQVGLRKLPENVRNKMGYMKKGGMTKKGYARGGSMKKKGYAMGGMTKSYGVVDNLKKKR